MKRTKISKIFEPLPGEILRWIEGAEIWDSSCSPEARVWLIDRDGGYYLKRSAKETLALEASMTAYFHKKGLGPEVLLYLSEDYDWLLTARVPGEDCTHAEYLADPQRLCDTIAERLRALHEIDPTDCPVRDRMDGYFALVDENYRKGQWDVSFLRGTGLTDPQAAYALVKNSREDFRDRVLLHGDYCLPNIILNNWRFSGFIDLGNGGIGDRHVDLFWGAWTLWFNLKTDAWRERFFDAYGRDLIEEKKLRIVAAAEVFG